MIRIIPNVPLNLAAFEATLKVDAADYDTVVIPEVTRKVQEQGKLNFLLYINTDLANFSIGAWFKDVLMGIQQISKWNRAAIVTEHDAVVTFTDAFSYIMPGKFKGFKKEQLAAAIAWASEQTD